MSEYDFVQHTLRDTLEYEFHVDGQWAWKYRIERKHTEALWRVYGPDDKGLIRGRECLGGVNTLSKAKAWVIKEYERGWFSYAIRVHEHRLEYRLIFRDQETDFCFSRAHDSTYWIFQEQCEERKVNHSSISLEEMAKRVINHYRTDVLKEES